MNEIFEFFVGLPIVFSLIMIVGSFLLLFFFFLMVDDPSYTTMPTELSIIITVFLFTLVFFVLVAIKQADNLYPPCNPMYEKTIVIDGETYVNLDSEITLCEEE